MGNVTRILGGGLYKLAGCKKHHQQRGKTRCLRFRGVLILQGNKAYVDPPLFSSSHSLTFKLS